MKCPFCRSNQTEVYNTRSTKFGTQLWRRRRCSACHEAFTTYETPDLGFLYIQAQDGSQTPYSRARVYSAIVSSLDAQSSSDTANAVTDTVESKILDLRTRPVSAAQIATIILTTLKHFNTPA